MMSLVIGILAHNEAGLIGTLLEDLFHQTVLTHRTGGNGVDLCVVANGCSDGTADVARATLERLATSTDVSWSVVEQEIGSKTIAWNRFVHEIAPPDATYMVLLDADIRIPQHDLAERCIKALEEHPDAVIATSWSKKYFPEASVINLFRLLDPLFASRPGTGPRALCGQFYVARADGLRRVVLPAGLLSQDGFITAMLKTDALTRPETHAPIRLGDGAYHLHPAYTRLSQLFRFHKRQAVSTAVYQLIYRLLHTLPPDFDTRMAEIDRLNRDQPDWLARLIDEEVRAGDLRVSNAYIARRLRHGGSAGYRAALKSLFAVLLLPFDYWVGVRATEALNAMTIGSVDRNQGQFRIRSET